MQSSGCQRLQQQVNQHQPVQPHHLKIPRCSRLHTALPHSETALQVVPLLVDLSQRVAKHMALQQQQQQQLSSLLSAGGVRGSSSGALVDLSDAARRITSDVMGEMLLGEDLGGTRWE